MQAGLFASAIVRKVMLAAGRVRVRAEPIGDGVGSGRCGGDGASGRFGGDPGRLRPPPKRPGREVLRGACAETE